MTDSTLNKFVAAGTAADRAAFTPSPPTPASGAAQGYVWHETDTGNTYSWKAGTGWIKDTASLSTAVSTVISGSISTVTSSVNSLSTAVGSGGGAFKGALVTKSVDQTGANYTSVTVLTWDSENYDTNAFHDTGSNTGRMTIPSGVSRVRLMGCVRLASLTADNFAFLTLEKSTGGGAATSVFVGGTQTASEVGSTTISLNLASPVLSVSAGDYFQLTLVVESDSSLDVIASRSWFAIEVVE